MHTCEVRASRRCARGLASDSSYIHDVVALGRLLVERRMREDADTGGLRVRPDHHHALVLVGELEVLVVLGTVEVVRERQR